MLAVICIICLIAIWYVVSGRLEGFRSCRYCADQKLSKKGTLVLNPYVWPYSGTECIDSIYDAEHLTSADNSADYTPKDFGNGPLVHLNTPDHVELTN